MSAEQDLRSAFSTYEKAREGTDFSDEKVYERLALLRYAAESLARVREEEPSCEYIEKDSAKEPFLVSVDSLSGLILKTEGIFLSSAHDEAPKAVEILKKAATYRPFDVSVWNHLTKACTRAFLRDEALQSNAKALEIDPNDLTARKYRDSLNSPTVGVRPPPEWTKNLWEWNFIICLPVGILGIVAFFTQFSSLALPLLIGAFGIWYYAYRKHERILYLQRIGIDLASLEPRRTL